MSERNSNHDKLQKLDWNSIASIMQYFCVWVDSPELVWFRAAWRHLELAGLTQYQGNEDQHRVFLRAVALGMMYGDYCELEWDLHSDNESTIAELYYDDTISHVRIGAMGKDLIDTNDADDHSMFVTVVTEMAGSLRFEVYKALVKGFGDPLTLYASLTTSRDVECDLIDLRQVVSELFDDSSCLIGGRDEAFSYVLDGAMLAIDA